MRTRKALRLMITFAAVSLIAAACGGSGVAETTTTASAVTQAQPDTVPPTSEPAAATSAAEFDILQVLPGFWKSSWGEFGFTADGEFLTLAHGSAGTIKDAGTYRVVGDLLTVVSGAMYGVCLDESGTFAYTVIDADTVMLELAGDGCDARALGLDSRTLTRVDSLSVLPQTTTTTTTIPFEDLTALDASLARESDVASRGVVTAGVYRSATLTVPIRYQLEQEVDVQVWDNALDLFGPRGFALERDLSIAFTEFDGFPEPDQVAEHDHPASPPLVEITRVSDWVRFFNDNDGLILLDSGTADVSGTVAPWWEFTADPSAGDGYDCPYGDNCFNIAFVNGVGYFIVGEDWTVRLWRIDSESGPVYAWFQAPNDDFADGLKFGQDIIDGVTVG